MKALIRNGKVYTEDCWSSFTRTHLDWMCGKEKDADGKLLPGDGWTLVENYTVTMDAPVSYTTVEEEDVVVQEDTVVIDGKEYTKAELRALLGE